MRVPLDRPVDLAIGSTIVPGKAMDVSYGGCRVSIPADRLTHLPVERAPAVVDVKLRSGGRSQSFPVVVSNWLVHDDVVEIGFAFGKLKRRHYQAISELMFGDVKEIAAFREGRGAGATASCMASPCFSDGASRGQSARSAWS